MPDNSETSNTLEAMHVLFDLLSEAHGWWYDYLDPIRAVTGRIRWSLRGTPYHSPGFTRLYSANDRPTNIYRLVDKQDHRKVVTLIREASQPGAVGRSETLRLRNIDGTFRSVEVYVRRLMLPSGQPILASLHTDFSSSSQFQWINRTVLDRLNAFVFVKEFNPLTGLFHFTYPEPWNDLPTALTLAGVWAAVSLLFAVSRSLLAAILLDNILATVGFVKNGLSLPQPALHGWLLAVSALVVFVGVFRFSRR